MKIVFPIRKAKILSLKLSQFHSDDSKKIYTLEAEMDNGDVIKAYDSKPFDVVEGETIRYQMTKTERKSKTKIMKLLPLVSTLDGTSITDLMFIDIETVRIQNKSPNKNTELYKSWEYKRRKSDDSTAADLKKSFQTDAALYSEFGKIVCISIGLYRDGEGLVVNSYYGDNEEEILDKFSGDLVKFTSAFKKLKLCGFSIGGFDIPYLMRRMIVNRIRVPEILNVMFKAPWHLEDQMFDIAQALKGSSFYGASLVNTCVSLGIPSPKDAIDGSMVSDTFYKNKDGIKEIVKYCEKDVLAVFNIMQHLYNMKISSTFVSKTFDNE